ncbi:hypothetical protein [Streptomyces sp. NPDC006309]|uniref:hypothetical protein n=1 Tax=Streptomyces sp. NPDC006309 TaxID=3156749 RepID=UPI0033BDC9F0
MSQQTVMLLRAEGLHSCAQMAWAKSQGSVAEVLSPPDELILFRGMSIGLEHATARDGRTGRAPPDETVTFVDGLWRRALLSRPRCMLPHPHGAYMPYLPT